MDKTVIGIFEPTTNTEHLINDLQAEGYSPQDISIVMRDPSDVEELHESSGATEKTAEGMTTGALVGGIMGLLAAVIIPGIGGLLVGGPLAAALGLTGTAATAASGAVTGAVAGGLLGALTGLGVPREEALRYQERIKEGAILVAVPTKASEAEAVVSIFHNYYAVETKTLTHGKRRYREKPADRRQYGFAGGRAKKRS